MGLAVPIDKSHQSHPILWVIVMDLFSVCVLLEPFEALLIWLIPANISKVNNCWLLDFCSASPISDTGAVVLQKPVSTKETIGFHCCVVQT